MNRALLTTALIALLNSTVTFADPASGLLGATAARDTALVARLLAHGADVDTTDSYGSTPLMIAAGCDYADVAAILVDSGADVNAVGRIATPR
jgi:ankyrin repeat protein